MSLLNRAAAMAVLPVLLAGCFYADLLVEYNGPKPNKLPIQNEIVVVREVQESSIRRGEPGGFFADRSRYVQAGQPHDINRIVHVGADSLQPRLVALNIAVGDTLRISATFDRIYTSGPHLPIPDWPNSKLEEYPVAYHKLTAIEKLSH